MHHADGPTQRPRVHFLLISAAILITQLATTAAYASDPVVDWIAITNDTVIRSGTNPLLTSRILSLLSASVFDSVNGIEPRYRSLHVRRAATLFRESLCHTIGLRNPDQVLPDLD